MFNDFCNLVRHIILVSSSSISGLLQGILRVGSGKDYQANFAVNDASYIKQLRLLRVLLYKGITGRPLSSPPCHSGCPSRDIISTFRLRKENFAKGLEYKYFGAMNYILLMIYLNISMIATIIPNIKLRNNFFINIP